MDMAEGIYVLEFPGGLKRLIRADDDEGAKKEAEKEISLIDKSWPNWRGGVLYKQIELSWWQGAERPEIPELKDFNPFEEGHDPFQNDSKN